MPSIVIMERYHAIRMRLREAREAAGVSQEQVAAKLTGQPGTSSRRSWLSRIETGRAVPEVPTLIGLAHALDHEVAVVHRSLLPLLDLDTADVEAILGAAHVAAHGRLLGDVQRMRVRLALGRFVRNGVRA